ncbi:YecA/YgfB family protein [Vibrio neonatus]|uniref:YecA/YgfB family protein n=1 Tax=Vibrio neonatus TaxID=278860 RepID=UPI0021C3C79F|nr:YecA family protein [Vibrio neonatus]
MSQISLPNYLTVADELKTAEIAITPAEMHGLLIGMLSGGLSNDSEAWQSLLFDYTNDGMGWPMACLAIAEQSLKLARAELADDNFELSTLLPEDQDIQVYAQAMAEWVSHFVSGLGLIDAQMNKASAQTKEALQDLLEIAKLEVDAEDDQEEQAALLEQVLEHVKVCVLTIHTELGRKPAKPESKTVH